jgi:hypothetical protein
MSAARAACLLLFLACLAPALSARAAPEASADDEDPLAALELDAPYAPLVREHYYRILSRSPTKAFLWELGLPGAGHFYVGFPIQAGVAIGLSALGAALWIAGAARDQKALFWTGMATFTAGRVYGLISAPVTAVLLNAAYRRQFGITRRF